MTPLEAVASGASTAVLGHSMLGRVGRVRSASSEDMLALARCEDVAPLVAMRAGLTERTHGSLARAGIAVAVATVLATIGFALVAPSESLWRWVVALAALALLAAVTWIPSWDSEARARAWLYLLDRRIGELEGRTGAGHHNFAPTASFTGTFAPSVFRFGRTGRGDMPGEDQVTPGP